MSEIKLEPTVMRSGDVVCFDDTGARLSTPECQRISERIAQRKRQIFGQVRASVIRQVDEGLARNAGDQVNNVQSDDE